MAQAPARIISGGRVTLPADLRRRLGLEPGDYVIVDVEPIDGGGPG